MIKNRQFSIALYFKIKASGELSAGIGQTGGGAVSNLIEGVNPLLSLIYKMVINVLEGNCVVVR